MDQLKAMGIVRNRVRLDGLIPPPENSDVTVEDARKLLKAAQLELVKSRLKEIRESCIPYSEFVRICAEYCSDQDQAKRTAKMLDDSAAVIVVGDVVFLRPEQVAISLFFLYYFLGQLNSFFPVLSFSLVFFGLVLWVSTEGHDRLQRYVSHTFHLFLPPFIWRLPRTDKFLRPFLLFFFDRKLKVCCFARSKTCKGFHVSDGKLGLMKDCKSP